MNPKHKAFTLVEMLIVIVIMAVLASMMMMSSSESISTAKASSVVNNLQSLVVAGLAFYTASLDSFSSPPYPSGNLIAYVLPYTHNANSFPDSKDYCVKPTNNGLLWAGYNVGGSADGPKLKPKLSGRASIANLKGTKNDTPPDNEDAADYNGEAYVWKLIKGKRL